MLKTYEKFLDNLDNKLAQYFEFEKDDIVCKQGCSHCCEHGDYPFSRLELEYLMQGILQLEPQIKKQVFENFKKITNKFDYTCPFLINKSCCIYKYRSITCRTHGLAYLNSENIAKLPDCTNLGLNFSNTFDPKTSVITREIIKENLDLNEIIKNANKNLEFGEIRALVNWFNELK